MVMGETQPHVSRLGRLRKAPESGQSGPTIDLCEFLGSSLSLEQSTNLSDGIYRHGAPEYPDKSHLGPDWPLSGALRSLPRRLTWDCVSPITISTIGDKPPRGLRRWLTSIFFYSMGLRRVYVPSLCRNHQHPLRPLQQGRNFFSTTTRKTRTSPLSCRRYLARKAGPLFVFLN